MFYCKDCKDKFEDKISLSKHKVVCPAIITKCKWVYKNGRKCNFRGQYTGSLCKRHCVGKYVYNKDGIVNLEGGLEGCGHIDMCVCRPISMVELEQNSSLVFFYRGASYKFVKSTDNTAIMVNQSSNEEIVFWKNKEARKKKSGPLINNLKSEEFETYCENTAICIVNNNFYCEKCFCKVHNCRIETLIQTDPVMLINTLKELDLN
jgi:hypothetical protein